MTIECVRCHVESEGLGADGRPRFTPDQLCPVCVAADEAEAEAIDDEADAAGQ